MLFIFFLLIAVSCASSPCPSSSLRCPAVLLGSVDRGSSNRCVPSTPKISIRNRLYTNLHASWVPYDVVDAANIADGNMKAADSNINTKASADEAGSGFMPTLIPLPLVVDPSVSSTQSCPTSSRISLASCTSLPVLISRQSSRVRSYSTLMPIFVGSAIGATLLILVAVLVVCCRRRGPLRRSIRPTRWFDFDNKEDIVVSIHVPPPTVPLRGILLPSSGHSCPDRLSLTSSQLSMIINHLPKARTSTFDLETLSQMHLDVQGPPVRATRIGPSPSDFLTNLFGQSDHPMPSDSTASQTLSSQTRICHVNLSLNNHRSVTALGVHVPQTTIPSGLIVSSGPRGHGLVLTGDKRLLGPSLAQWRRQEKANPSLVPY